MATFTTWAAELQRFKNAIASTPQSELLKAGYSDGRGQLITFRRLSDIQNHISFLEEKAAAEANPGGKRTPFFLSGYRGR